jgi:hypothetical protein
MPALDMRRVLRTPRNANASETRAALRGRGCGDRVAKRGEAGGDAGGSRVYFATAESLVGEDTDASADVYERSGGQTTLISAGGNGAFGVGFDGASAVGTHVFMLTFASLVGADTDGARDVYERSGGQTTLVSTGPAVCSQGGWTNDPTSFAYRWNRDGAAITGATSSSYTVTDADAARQISCTVTAANADGGSSATSAPVTPPRRHHRPAARPAAVGA